MTLGLTTKYVLLVNGFLKSVPFDIQLDPVLFQTFFWETSFLKIKWSALEKVVKKQWTMYTITYLADTSNFPFIEQINE